MKKEQTTTCEPCQDQFEKNVKQIVHEGKKPTMKAHDSKKKEVTAAFHGESKPKK